VAHGDPVDELGLVLRLLDHQVLGEDDEMLGKLEDLVLERRDGGVAVVGLVLGTGGWAPRQVGVIGHWVEAVWRRLDREEDPSPTTLSLVHVRHLDSAVHVDEAAARFVASASDLERWLRRHLIAPIPGSGVDGDDDPDPQAGGADLRAARTAPLDHPRRFRLSTVLRARVEDTAGTDLGRVTEVHAAPRTGEDGTPELALVSVTHGGHLVGNGLGYGDESHAGPVVLARLVRWWHRHEQVTRWADVLVLPDPRDPDGALRVRAGASRPAR
jgi:sporulation protein YlmC with PRC-barrel domain